MSTPADPLPPDVLEALQRGRTIEAIKLLRTSRNMGLKEAKDAIDAARGNIKATGDLSPGQVSGGGGGLVWWLVAGLIAGIAAYLFFP